MLIKIYSAIGCIRFSNSINHFNTNQQKEINMQSKFKLTIFAPSGKITAIYKFTSFQEAMNFILLNELPRYHLYA